VKLEAAGCFKMSATFHPSVRHRIPEDLTYGHAFSLSVENNWKLYLWYTVQQSLAWSGL